MVVVLVVVVCVVLLSGGIGLGFVLVDEARSERSELPEVLVSKFCVDTEAEPSVT